MLEGLEAVELKLSEVLKDNDRFRLNSEFFRKEYLQTLERLKKTNAEYLNNYLVVNRRFKQPIYDENSPFKVINSQYIREYFIDYDSARNGYGEIVPKEAVLVNATGVGTLGRVNINYLDESFSIDNHINVIIPKRDLNPYYLMSFLQCKYGQSLINRYYSGSSGQIEIYAKDFEKFLIPIFSEIFQKQIETLVKTAYEKLQDSNKLYREAEELLLDELDLKDFKASDENISIKSLKESFLSSGRLDSEYYQPKYEQIKQKIKEYGCDKLINVCNVKDKNFNPKENKKYKYIELSNIGNEGEITGYIYELGKNLPSRARRKINSNDVIVPSVEGSINKVAIVTDAYNNSLCSTGFYVLNSEQINSSTLLVLFKNKIYQEILKQNCSGTILTAINKDDFYNLEIPIIKDSVQDQLEQIVTYSFNLKKESKKLLDLAKKAVEVAIERNEESALMIIEGDRL